MKKIRKVLATIYRWIPRRIRNKVLFDHNKRYAHYLKLKCKYSKYIDTKIKCDDRSSNYIFSCWLQGKENAPALVQACFKSMKACMPEKNLVIITAENYKNYVSLPDYIIKKWQQGKISNTHFSDVLRTALIVKNGGLWLDSTVFCTGSIDRYVNKDTDLFVYRNEHRGDKSSVLSNWLIYAKPNNPILVNTLKILNMYWKTHNRIIDYFMYHQIFTLVTEKFQQEWEKVPFYSNIEPHVLWFHHFYKNFNQETFERIKKLSNFHKLSYKFDKDKLEKDNFYDEMINEKIK